MKKQTDHLRILKNRFNNKTVIEGDYLAKYLNEKKHLSFRTTLRRMGKKTGPSGITVGLV